MSKVIEIKDGRIFQQKELVLKDIQFELGNVEFAYLIGKTGSGKSSLLKCLYGEVALGEGQGEVAGFDLTKLRRADIPILRRELGIVFQDFQLLTDRTVEQNLFFVMKATGWKEKKAMRKRSEEILELVGLGAKAKAKPFNLSGGEQQRLSIARALINRPKLILADEPTGNLDPETSEEIMRLLIAVAQEEKSAILMATHDMTIVEKYPGRVFRVENGTIREVQSIDRFNPFEPFSAD
ncbi:MAG: ATP-binding cassette domain-containing protein [Crocinitomicaceae bacterium]|jgi:cell division transport system ATP-binding protein|nr:ATP-binding cassette domain-containing protein [Crocinitomicaceae bacterium]